MTDNTNLTNLTNLTNTTSSNKGIGFGEFILTGFIVIMSATIIVLILERIFKYNQRRIPTRRIENIELENIQHNDDNPQINIEPTHPNLMIEDEGERLPSYDEIIVQEQ